jgi:transposase
MKTVTLNAKQRQEILERRRQTGERRIFQRLSALLWIDEGRTREEVAELLGVSSRQVGDWLRIYRNKGLDQLCTLHYRGDPGRLRPAQVQRLRQEIATGVFHNAEQVRAWIEEQFGVTYSTSGVKDLLHRIGASYHKVSGFFRHYSLKPTDSCRTLTPLDASGPSPSWVPTGLSRPGENPPALGCESLAPGSSTAPDTVGEFVQAVGNQGTTPSQGPILPKFRLADPRDEFAKATGGWKSPLI